MGIFSETPKSFKMDRKSPLASTVKSSISEKLFQFLGNYTDDVLAEYIIVLVCNGKHQIQARDDLEAFLGERSGDFVSWLWDHLLKYAQQSNSDIGLLDPKDLTAISPNNSGAERDLRSNRLKDVRNHGSGNSDSPLVIEASPTQHGKYQLQSIHASTSVRSNNMEISGSMEHCKVATSPLNRVNTNKIINHKGNGLPSPKREIVPGNLQPSSRDGAHATQTYALNTSARSPPSAAGERSFLSKKSRGSVWDRLGKSCEEHSFLCDEAVDAHAVAIEEKHIKSYDQNRSSVPLRGERGRIKSEVYELDKSIHGSMNNASECRKVEQGVSTICKLPTNNIGRKRHFGEISPGPCSNLRSSVGRNNMDHQSKESLQEFKRSNSTPEAAASTLVTQVQDVKERLHQVEREISKLRTKQLEVKKYGQPKPLLNPGAIKYPKEDVESRTVFVTNVHFAATKEALSSHFAKCGVVLNVVILTDKLNGLPKGSAYITFANKESVDKAVALSGNSFFSRTLKVVKKAEEAAVTSTSIPPQHAGKMSRAHLTQINRKPVNDKPFYPGTHLQWRREPVSAPSDLSSSIVQEKRVSSAASQQ